MKLDRFLEEREPRWDELQALVQAAKGRPSRLRPAQLLRLGALYRSAAADLATARRRWPRDPSVTRLEDLVQRARVIVYSTPRRGGSLRDFFSAGYWRRVRERPVFLLIAAAFLVVPALPAFLWGLQDPHAALAFVPSEYHSIMDPDRETVGGEMSGAAQAAFSSFVFTNNIRVTFLAFATGVAAGIGTALVLAYNGVFFGAIAGLATVSGNAAFFVELVSAHGMLELSCIVVTAAAGFRLGWALVHPGTKTRGEALVDEARPALEIVLGTAPWLVLAGLVEGFITPSGLGVPPAVLIGLTLAALYWALIARAGRSVTSGRAA